MIVVVAIYVVSLEIDVVNSNINLTIDSFVLFFSMTISSIISTSSIVDTLLEIVLSNNITIYDQTNVVDKLIIVIDSFSNIWNNQNTIVNISKNQWIFIIFKFETKLKLVKIYSINSKKQFVIDVTFDKMYTNDKITWAN